VIQKELYLAAVEKYRSWFGKDPTVAAYAPGRVEILGNHTDYNEGFVLSAAITFGTFFLASPASGTACRIVAGDIMEEAFFSLSNPIADKEHQWANYVLGVAAELAAQHGLDTSFDSLFFGNVPLGSGLSSSAALEMSTALALLRLNDSEANRVDLAKIGQKAEHDYAGANTGLLDQISSLYGEKDRLVMSDFRSLEITTVPLSPDVCFLICDTGTKHSLGDSDYNTRREACERAAEFFKKRLDHPVAALRDVSINEWQTLADSMPAEDAKRSAHVIGENTRVLAGKELLSRGAVDEFGELMFRSHESSRYNFENSCVELDVIVEAAAEYPEVLGARLSGGGFGGSAVLLLRPSAVEKVASAIGKTYRDKTGRELKTHVIEASSGAFSFTPGAE
jgi:galactokinase